MAMKKILIDIPQEAIKSLDDIAERKKLSRAEVIRRAIEIAIHAESSSGFKQAFGAWSHRKSSGIDLQRKLRKEWE